MEMSKKFVNEFVEQNLLSEDGVRKHYEKNIEESKSIISAMGGVDEAGLATLMEKMDKLTETEIHKLTVKEVEELLGEDVIRSIDTTIKHASLAKKHAFRKDYLLLLKEYDKLEEKLDGEIEALRESDAKFKKEIDEALQDINKYKQDLKESLTDIIDSKDSTEMDRNNAVEMLRALTDVEELSFLKNHNTKALVKLCNNKKELDRITKKALKIINKHSYSMNDEIITDKTFKAALYAYAKSLELNISDEILYRIGIIITIRFFKFISRTKQLDVYEKAYILYFKTLVKMAASNETIKSVSADKFKENLKKYYTEVK